MTSSTTTIATSAVDLSTTTPTTLLTPTQLRRLDEIFHNMYGYHFVSSVTLSDKNNNTSSSDTGISDESKNETTITNNNNPISLPSPPMWLYNVMGNHMKHTTRVWNLLSPLQQQQLLKDPPPFIMRSPEAIKTNIPITTTKKRSLNPQHDDDDRTQRKEYVKKSFHQNNPITESIIHSDNDNNRSYDSHIVVSTNMIPTTTDTTTSILPTPTSTTTTTSNNNNNPKSNLTSLLQQLDGTKKVTTITKTALDWEQYKQQSDQKDTLEQHSTSTTAYIPKKEFLQRVDIRKYENEKQQRLLTDNVGKKGR